MWGAPTLSPTTPWRQDTGVASRDGQVHCTKWNDAHEENNSETHHRNRRAPQQIICFQTNVKADIIMACVTRRTPVDRGDGDNGGLVRWRQRLIITPLLYFHHSPDSIFKVYSQTPHNRLRRVRLFLRSSFIVHRPFHFSGTRDWGFAVRPYNILQTNWILSFSCCGGTRNGGTRLFTVRRRRTGFPFTIHHILTTYLILLLHT